METLLKDITRKNCTTIVSVIDSNNYGADDFYLLSLITDKVILFLPSTYNRKLLFNTILFT